MKRMIKASWAAQREANGRAKKIYRTMQTLFNLLEDAPEGFVDENDLTDLYDALLEDLPALNYAINKGEIKVKVDSSDFLSEEEKRILRNADTSDWSRMQTEYIEDEIRDAEGYDKYIARERRFNRR